MPSLATTVGYILVMPSSLSRAGAESPPRGAFGASLRQRGVALVQLEQLGSDGHRDRARRFVANAGDAYRASHPRQDRAWHAKGCEPPLELCALRRGADQPEIGEIGSSKDRPCELEVESVAMGHDQERAPRRRVPHLVLRRIGDDRRNIRRHARREIVLALIDPGHRAGQGAENLHQRPPDVTIAEDDHAKVAARDALDEPGPIGAQRWGRIRLRECLLGRSDNCGWQVCLPHLVRAEKDRREWVRPDA